MRGVMGKATICGLVLAAVVGCMRMGWRGEQGPHEEPFRVVKVTGVERCYNWSLHQGMFMTTPMDGHPGALLARDRDMVCAEMKSANDEGEATVIFPYRPGDGDVLNFEQRDGLPALTDNPYPLSLALDGPKNWELLGRATEEELSGIRVLALPSGPSEAQIAARTKLESGQTQDMTEAQVQELRSLAESAETLDDRRMDILRRVALVNPHVGLVFEGDGTSLFKTLLPMFQPRFLATGDMSALTDDDIALIVASGQIEELWISGDSVPCLDFLQQMPKLRRLALTDWDPAKTGPIPLLPKLESLTIQGAKLMNLAPLAAAENLRELHLTSLKPVEEIGDIDLEGLTKFKSLEVLSVLDVEKLHLPELNTTQVRWLSLLADRPQDEFAQTVASLPDLRVLELCTGEQITDLPPLKSLTKLEALSWFPEGEEQIAFGLEVIKDMKSLRYVMLPREVFEKYPEQAAKLQEALPNAVLAPGAPICLGSGWILLLVPAALAGWAVMRLRTARRAA